ncbi:hypothetical protein BH10PSE6_BH10PSE6_08650 [soil metagenome]
MTFASTFLPMPAQTLALSRYDVACRAVAAAKAVDDVMEIVAHADAVRVYARQAKDRQMEIDAVEIRIRAERRLGELMAAQKAKGGVNSGTAGQGRPKIGGVPNTPPKHDAPPILAEAGIDKNLAKRARSYAAVPPAQFEKLLTDKRQGENRRVVLDPDVEAKAGAAAGDIESERDERIAPACADGLAAENDRLARQMAGLRRRLAALIEENGALKDREKMWKERALAAGWK